jgi:RNA 2',3'-cyclic 3'-phosphodiesterase
VRLFLAINLAPSVRQAIIDATSPLRDAAPTLGWVDEARVHLTLKFLGDQTESVVASMRGAMDDVTGRHRPFSMQLGGIGAFPNFRRARVVWMGIEREPRLELLHHDIEVACETLGFELEGRAFHPHLTLARVRERTAENELRSLAKASKGVTYEDAVSVASVDLMHSTLNPKAARYACLHSALLGKR